MCFSCDDCAYYVGNTLYTCERLVSCCAMTAVVCCLIATLLIMLGMGVGVGYNYCYIDNKVVQNSTTPDEEITTESLRRLYSRNFSTNYNYRYLTKNKETKNKNSTKRGEILTATTLPFLVVTKMKPTMVIPLRKPNLLSLITRLVQNDKNVTLELVV